MDSSGKKQTLSSSSLPLLNKNGILCQQSKIPILNGIRMSSSLAPSNNQRSTTLTLRSSSTNTISSGGTGSNGSSTGKLLLSSKSLRGEKSILSSNRTTTTPGVNVLVSSNDNAASALKSVNQRPINDVKNGGSSSSTLTSSSAGLKLITSNGNGNTTVTLANGSSQNHSASKFPPFTGTENGTGSQSVKLLSSNGTSASVLERNGNMRHSSTSVDSNTSSSSGPEVSTSEFSVSNTDTTASSSFDDGQRNRNDSPLDSDADNSIDIFAQTPAAKIVRFMMVEPANSDPEAESDGSEYSDVIVPATQEVLSPHGSSALDLDPDAIVIVVESDEEDSSCMRSGSLDPAETAMVIESPEEDSDASTVRKADESLNAEDGIIVPATQQFSPNLSDTQSLGMSVVPCSDEEDESSLSPGCSPTVLVQNQKNVNEIETHSDQHMNSTFTVSPYPMKISSRGAVGRNPSDKHGSTSSVPKLQLDPIQEMDLDQSLNHLNATSTSDCRSNQNLNSTFVMNIPSSQKSNEELNVTFTAISAPVENNSGSCSDNKITIPSLQDKSIEEEQVIKTEVLPESENLNQTPPIPEETSTTVRELSTPMSSVPPVLKTEDVQCAAATPSPRRGKKLYDIPMPPPLKTVEPTKPIDSSDSEEEQSVSGNKVVGGEGGSPATASRCAKPKTYSKRGRDSKADRDALFETENPRPSTSAALVRHNMRSLKMKTKASSKKDGKELKVVKSNRALARSRSKYEEANSKVQQKPKPKLKLPSKVKKVLSSSDEEHDENEARPLEDLPELDSVLLSKSKSNQSGNSKPSGADVDALATENSDAPAGLKEHSESGNGTADIKAVEVPQDLVMLKSSTSAEVNQQILPNSTEHSLTGLLEDLDAPVHHAVVEEEFISSRQGNPESVEEKPPTLPKESSKPVARKRGRPTRNQRLKVDGLPPVCAPVSDQKSESCVQNQRQNESDSNEIDMERNETDAQPHLSSGLSSTPTFSPSQKSRSRAQSTLQGQSIRSSCLFIDLSSDSDSELEPKRPKKLDSGAANKTSTKEMTQKDASQVSVSRQGSRERSLPSAPPKRRTKSKKASISKTRRGTKSNSSDMDSGIEVSKYPSSRNLSRARSTPSLSEASEAEPEPPKLSAEMPENKKSAKRKGVQIEVIEEEPAAAEESQARKPKRGRQTKKKIPEEDQLGDVIDVVIEPVEMKETDSPKSSKVASIKPANLKNSKQKERKPNPRGKKVVPLQEPEPEITDVPLPEPVGLRRSRRTRKERDLGDGMVPYYKN